MDTVTMLDGEIRRNNGDRESNTFRDTYGENFAKGYRGDMKLETLLRSHVIEFTVADSVGKKINY